MSDASIAVLVGSLRKDSFNRQLAQALTKMAPQGWQFKISRIDDLPLYNQDDDAQQAEPVQRLKAEIAAARGVVFVTPEYNHGISGALKNAIDFLFKEWNNKAAGFVGYGSAGGVRAVESLRLVMGEVMIATVRAQVMLSLFTDFENYTTFKPAAHHEKNVGDLLDQLVAWSGALQSVRKKQAGA